MGVAIYVGGRDIFWTKDGGNFFCVCLTGKHFNKLKVRVNFFQVSKQISQTRHTTWIKWSLPKTRPFLCFSAVERTQELFLKVAQASSVSLFSVLTPHANGMSTQNCQLLFTFYEQIHQIVQSSSHIWSLGQTSTERMFSKYMLFHQKMREHQMH